MLQIVMRPSIESPRTASPRYSMTWPFPPSTPMTLSTCRIRSFATVPSGSGPSTSTASVRGMRCGSVWVARTCSTSEVPMPKARAPNAPWVAVCESPHTMTAPGWVSPSSGPMTWTIPWLRLPISKSVMPNSSAFRRIASICAAESWSSSGSRPRTWAGSVGTLWSIVASVRSGRRTRRPAARSPSKACGEVTSCTRWRST